MTFLAIADHFVPLDNVADVRVYTLNGQPTLRLSLRQPIWERAGETPQYVLEFVGPTVPLFADLLRRHSLA